MQNVYMQITTQIKEKFKRVLAITTSLDFYREVIRWIQNKIIFRATRNYLKDWNSWKFIFFHFVEDCHIILTRIDK